MIVNTGWGLNLACKDNGIGTKLLSADWVEHAMFEALLL